MARIWRSLPSSVRVGSGLAGFGAAYFAIASVSLIQFGVSTPIWFANAFAVALLVQHPTTRWPVMLGLLYVADAAAIHFFAQGPSLLVAVADLVETAIAALLVRKLGGPEAALSSVTRLAAFVSFCLLVPAISASWGAGVLYFSFGEPLVDSFIDWYSASALGLLVACPILLIWFTRSLRISADLVDLRVFLILLAALGALSWVVTKNSEPAYLLTTFPALLMLVWRGGLLGASLGSALLVGMGLWRTLTGEGAFVSLSLHHDDPSEHIEALQVYSAALILSSLPLAVVLTDQRRLARELTRVADARSEFLSAMSHEIRTPMTGVLGMVDLLDSEAPTPRQREQLGSIRASGRHLVNILNDILDFSRIETGKIELERIDFSLPLLLDQVRNALQPLARERGIELTVGLTEGSPPTVRGDPTRIQQILLNLAGNAIKFTPQGSVLVLAAYCPDDSGPRFRFEIRDTGIGLAADQQLHIFSAFTQADHSTSRRYGGSGLGLAISKRLVDLMGGEIGVESRLGEGSLFWFEIPLELGDVASLVSARLTDSSPIVPRRILLAEDVALNRDIISTMLSRDGHLVVVAEDGRDAVERVREQPFDLILMDVHMPVMDGLDATRAIRAMANGAADTPIIALTANVMASEQEKCRDAGMDSVLMKPVEWDLIRVAIRDCATTRSARPTTVTDTDGAAPAATTAPHHEAPFNEAIFAELEQLIPAGRLKEHAERLTSEVARLADAVPDADTVVLRQLAHGIVSQAGMLGLQRLSDRAAAVEQACETGESLATALKAFAAASSDPRDYLMARFTRPRTSSANSPPAEGVAPPAPATGSD